MRYQRNKAFFLAIWMLILAIGFSILPVSAAEELACKIGNVKYATLEAAIQNAKDGDTITLLRDVALTTSAAAVYSNVTIDGDGYSITAQKSGYCWQFYNGVTIKDVTIHSQAGIRMRYNPERDTTVNFENLTWNLTTGLLINIQSNDTSSLNTGSRRQTVNLKNCMIAKPTNGSASDPMIATYTNKPSGSSAGAIVTVNVEDSMMINASTATNWGNLAMFYFNSSGETTLNLKGRTAISNAPVNHSSGTTTVFAASVPVTVNMDAGVEILIPSVSKQATKNHIFNGNNYFTVNDAGATYFVCNEAIKQGLAYPTGMIYNGGKLSDMVVLEEGEIASKIGFMGDVKISLDAGASIRTRDIVGISFSGSIDKSQYNKVCALSRDVEVVMFLVAKTTLDKAIERGVTDFNQIPEDDKLPCNRVWMGESEDGNAVTFRGCWYDLDSIKEEYAVLAYLTYVVGNDTVTVAAEYSETDHVRSIYDVARQALADPNTEANDFLEKIVNP